MGNNNSATLSNINGKDNTQQAAALYNSTTMRRRANIKTVQNVLLIWLGANIDEKNNVDGRNAITQLRRVVNNINTFTNGDRCIEFINTIDNNNNKACMIISGSLGQYIVPRVHNMSKMDSIFIFCHNKNHHEQWAKDWFKIKGVFTEIAPICEALKKIAQQCEHNAISISFMATSSDVSEKNLDQLDYSFMYTQIFKDILLTIKFEDKHIKEFIKHCREQFADNELELINIKELEKKYYSKTPIWWYTCESFLYPLLNTALRVMDVDVIIKMGFFIGDLHRQIEQLHLVQLNEYQSGTNFAVYRGQSISIEYFEQMKKTKGGLMAFNNFLSTSKDRNVSLPFARNALANPDLVGILFVITIDPSLSTTPFASINGVSYFEDKEDEVLFSMHTVFRICDIKSMDENDHLYQVDLALISDNDNDLRRLTDQIRGEAEGSTGWDQLGKLLLKIGQAEQAQQVYEFLLKETNKEIEKAYIYYQIGWTKDDRGEYKEALTFYEKSLKIRQQLLPPKHLDLAKTYNLIGLVYHNIGEYSKALSSHEKALEIRRQSLPSNHPLLANSYNNIGLVYDEMGEYWKALLYYKKTLSIDKQTLPPNHPDSACTYNNIGGVYKNMAEYSKALSSHKKALEIRQQSLSPNHPDLANSHGNVGNVYFNMGEYSKALSSYEKALEIRQQSLHPNHPDLAMSYNNIGYVYYKMGEYSKALSFCQRAVDIGQQSLPSNHSELQRYKNNLDRAKTRS